MWWMSRAQWCILTEGTAHAQATCESSSRTSEEILRRRRSTLKSKEKLPHRHCCIPCWFLRRLSISFAIQAATVTVALRKDYEMRRKMKPWIRKIDAPKKFALLPRRHVWEPAVIGFGQYHESIEHSEPVVYTYGPVRSVVVVVLGRSYCVLYIHVCTCTYLYVRVCTCMYYMYVHVILYSTKLVLSTSRYKLQSFNLSLGQVLLSFCSRMSLERLMSC
jgi:hypothetical protein